MSKRLLNVTAHTTFDFLHGRVLGPEWIEEGMAVLDIESPRDSSAVILGIEFDPGSIKQVPPHADLVELSLGEARTLAAELETAAAAAESGEAMTSGRR